MQDLNTLDLDSLWRELNADAALAAIITIAQREDLNGGSDITTESIISPERTARAVVRAREEGIIVAERIAPAVLRGFGVALRCKDQRCDGEPIAAGEHCLALEGSLRAILRIERTLLNLISRLTGIATMPPRFVRAVRDTGAAICDTRKTTPGWRPLEKFAVRCGGGTLHRIGLY